MTTLTPSQEMSSGHRSSPRSSQVAVIRREFVDLTGDHFSAVVLNQLLYWTQRVKDFDLFLKEESRINPNCNVSPRHGWVYKTAPELIEETMLKASPPTMRKYLKHLIDCGYVDERVNPLGKWDKTTQYRVNLRKLQEDLIVIGHTLPEAYRECLVDLLQDEIHQKEFKKINALDKEKGNTSCNDITCNDVTCSPSLPSPKITEEKIFPSKENFSASKQKIFASNERIFGSYTYTENTPENKSKEHTQNACAREELHEFFEVWQKHVGQFVGQEALQLTENRIRQLRSLLTLYFDGDLQQWERFCERVKSSPFLMGQGPRKWHVTLDWILEESNLIKVLEGNFDDPSLAEKKNEEKLESNKERERSELLASIKDPSWKYWCTQLSRSDMGDPLSLFELKELVPAQFAEFDGRLVWIESENPRVLDRIENLRLKLISVVQKTFPKARNIRTQLKTPLMQPSPSEGAQPTSYSPAP